MSNSDQEQRPASRPGLYQEITDKIIRQIEAGTIPWVQPWAEDQTLSIPRNATTNRAYSGVNILLLWDALFSRGLCRQSLADLQTGADLRRQCPQGRTRHHRRLCRHASRPRRTAKRTRGKRRGQRAARSVPQTLHGFQRRPMRRPALRLHRPAQAGFAAPCRSPPPRR